MITWLVLLFSGLTLRAECLLVVDPGHGGRDLGTSTLQIREKDLALSYAKRFLEIWKRLSSKEVRLTRHEDRFISPEKRRELIANFGCQNVISLHFNGSVIRSRWGTEIYFGKETPSEWKERLEEWDYLNILAQFKQHKYHQESARWAMKLQRQLAQVFPERPIRLGRLPLTILQQSQMRGLVIEIGYLSNEQDRLKVLDPQFRDLFLETLAHNIVAQSGKDLPRK
ncbi:MAG: N-acetylmuramoyl-L-alanine amidase [Bdellovibrionaceae bacterium]|nr:N-acetylmuramoyl-L-alanine amidase [Pseudobdellovibrionaceae bacterium]MDW8190744.1 N-acetylmuramoyl-L-alanine amidase [Pseudobdellovibrionaceae bacterium]